VTTLVEVDDLSVCFDGGAQALAGVNLRLGRGESLAVVGESGSGKSTLAMCLAGLVQAPHAAGSIRLNGKELLGATEATLRSLRWTTVALALQGSPFNPVATIGSQVAEPLRERLRLGRKDAALRARDLAVEVLLDPALLDRYPHQVSGGERRRATLAMVLALDPTLVVLDEPTAGLDPATSQALVRRVMTLARDRGFALVVCTHDLTHAVGLATRTMVLYGGHVVEHGPTPAVLKTPVHPYSWALINAYPSMTTTKDLRPIRGLPPDSRNLPSGCVFHPRCTQAEDQCAQRRPALEPASADSDAAGQTARDHELACHLGGLRVLLSAHGLHKWFDAGKQRTQALSDVSFSLRQGESVGVVGPSGSGKSTLAAVLSGHLRPDSGQVEFQGIVQSRPGQSAPRSGRRRIQLVMQDPIDALSPRLSIERLVAEPLEAEGAFDAEQRRGLVLDALESVGLPRSGTFLTSYAHQLSGGQLQRVALARALVCQPLVLVADEPTSQLDPSEQARLLGLLRERQVELGLGLVLVSHDLAMVRKVTDRIVVLDGGRVVEVGPSEVVSVAPASSTAQRLVHAASPLALDHPGLTDVGFDPRAAASPSA